MMIFVMHGCTDNDMLPVFLVLLQWGANGFFTSLHVAGHMLSLASPGSRGMCLHSSCHQCTSIHYCPHASISPSPKGSIVLSTLRSSHKQYCSHQFIITILMASNIFVWPHSYQYTLYGAINTVIEASNNYSINRLRIY